MRWSLRLLCVCLVGACGDDRAPPASSALEAPPEAARDDEVEPPADNPEAPSRTRLVLLGTGNPNADPARSGPSVAVVVDDVAYVVDAGPGLVRRAAAASEAHPALTPERITHAFITHLHSDHTVGLPDLVFTPWVLGREAPLSLYGPPGLEAMSEHIALAWAEDIAMRTDGLEGANRTGYRIDAHEVGPGVVLRDERVTVRAFAVEHGSWSHAYGYRFEGPDRTIVISGDTRASDAIVEACDGCDVLVHEVYSAARYPELSESWRRYHASFHTSSHDLAEIASRANPGLLVLYHHLLWGAEPDSLVAEVREGWDGDVRFGRDLDAF